MRLTAHGRRGNEHQLAARSGFTRLSRLATVPLFILVPQVSVRERLDVEGMAQKWIGALPQLVLRNSQNRV